MAFDWLKGDVMLPPKEMRAVSGPEAGSAYRAAGRKIASRVRELCEGGPADTILEIGCGCGRVAAGLAASLGPEARYCGFDVMRAHVEWARKNIGARRREFEFTHADLRHGEYNPEGSGAASEYTFPYADGRFDLAFATAVFTHLLEPDVRRYVAETARVLRRGGRALFTFFVVDAGEEPPPHPVLLGFRHRTAWGAVANADSPERRVAYDEPVLLAMLEASGLALDRPILRGSWSGRRGCDSLYDLEFEDVLIARKR